ncbi:MAG: NHL repeat-containing protein [Nitrospinales bacterium]
MAIPSSQMKDLSFEDALKLFMDEYSHRVSSPEAREFLDGLALHPIFSEKVGEERIKVREKLEALKSVHTLLATGSFRSQENAKEENSPPSGLALTLDGDLIVTDDFNHRIQIYGKDGQLKTSFGGKGKGDGEFMYPRGAAVDPEGNIYVADSWNHRVQKFDPEGKHLFTYGSYGEDKGQLNEPYDVLIDTSGTLIVVERYNHRIQFFQPDGTSLGWIGNRGTLIEEHLAYIYDTPPHLLSKPVFEFPTAIARDSRNYFYIADSSNHRIVKFDSSWREVLSFGTKGDGPGQFQYPLCVSAAPNDLLYVADLNNERVQVFTPQGRYLFAFQEGAGNTPFKTPCLTLVDPRGTLYVGMTFNTTIFKFDLPHAFPEEVYRHLSLIRPDDTHLRLCQGQMHEENGNPELALEHYAESMRFLKQEPEEGNDASDADIERGIDLPVRIARLLQEGVEIPSIEPLISPALEFYEERIASLRRGILDLKSEWDQMTAKFVRKNLTEQNLILNQREELLVFNKELYLLEKEDKNLYRTMREKFYVYRNACEKNHEFITHLLAVDLPDSVVGNFLEHLQNRYLTLGEQIVSLLRIKEKNEIELVGAFSGLQDDLGKLEIFQTLYFGNLRILDVLKQFLCEFRAIVQSLKGFATKYKTREGMEQFLQKIFLESPGSGLFPEIIMGFQEEWEVLPALDKDLKDIMDLWITEYGSVESAIPRSLDLNYFSPVAYDTENIDTQDIVRSLLMENMSPERTPQGFAWGNENFVQGALRNTEEEFSGKLEEVYKNLEIYEQKSQELFQEVEKFHVRKEELETQLKQVDVRDKRAPISIQNNIYINDFQLRLLKRMTLTLEINEINNLIRLLIGSGLLACREDLPSVEEDKKLFALLRTFEDLLNERVRENKEEISKLNLEKGTLEQLLREDAGNFDISSVSETNDLRSQLIAHQFKLDCLELKLSRQTRLNSLMRRLFNFVREPEPVVLSIPPEIYQMTYKFSFGRTGSEAGCFLYPLGMTHTAEGDLLVADHNKHQIQRFSPQGIFLSRFGRWGNSPGAFKFPVGVQVDPQGCIYVADQFNRRVQKFTPGGDFLLEFGNGVDARQSLGEIYSLSIDSENNIWVADPQNNRIQIFSPSGDYLRSLGQNGDGAKDLVEPVSICCLENGDYVVGDKSEDKLKRYNSQGELQRALQKGVTGDSPIYMLVHDFKYGLFFTDFLNKKIIGLNSKMEVVLTYENPGQRAGKLGKISGFSIYQDQLMVADIDRHRIVVFALSERIEA